MEQERIMELFRRRDERAIEECLRSYGALLNRVARNILRSNEDAEECVSDALQKLWESYPTEPIVNLRAYLVAATRSFAFLRLRADSAEKRGGGEYALALSELEDCIPSRQSVAAEVEARALAKCIDRFLEALPTEDRVLFIRRYRLGDPVSLLAEETGISSARISKKLYTLRQRLRKYLVKEKFLE